MKSSGTGADRGRTGAPLGDHQLAQRPTVSRSSHSQAGRLQRRRAQRRPTLAGSPAFDAVDGVQHQLQRANSAYAERARAWRVGIFVRSRSATLAVGGAAPAADGVGDWNTRCTSNPRGIARRYARNVGTSVSAATAR